MAIPINFSYVMSEFTIVVSILSFTTIIWIIYNLYNCQKYNDKKENMKNIIHKNKKYQNRKRKRLYTPRTIDFTKEINFNTKNNNFNENITFEELKQVKRRLFDDNNFKSSYDFDMEETQTDNYQSPVETDFDINNAKRILLYKFDEEYISDNNIIKLLDELTEKYDNTSKNYKTKELTPQQIKLFSEDCKLFEELMYAVFNRNIILEESIDGELTDRNSKTYYLHDKIIYTSLNINTLVDKLIKTISTNKMIINSKFYNKVKIYTFNAKESILKTIDYIADYNRYNNSIQWADYE